ncbi:MAG TPA: hypothetical protein VKM72_24170 [Thermoanaerobaculia bacterium]|nr:hypothetical protein [Thermoanaerobaculia bacterium]
MAEPIRKPVHRPRPPHPHKRPHAVLVRSRLLPEADAETILPRPAPVRPALVPAPERATQPEQTPTELVFPLPGALVPPDEPLAVPEISKERSARSLLLAALALHLGVLLAAWFGQSAPDLDPADLLLSGAVLLSGGTMLVLGGLRR